MTEARLIANLMVPMRDGVRLAIDVYLPPGTGPWPLVLERTPYGKTNPSRSEIEAGQDAPLSRAAVAARFVSRGFAVAYQDCRGRYGSEGEFVKYLSDGHDGVDTMVWLRQQSWCDGRIATMGLSYAAHTQAALACLDPPGLAAMALDCGGFANAFQCGIRQGGAFELKQATWAYNQALESPEAKADPNILAALRAEDIKAWFGRMPWRQGQSPLRWVPEYEAYLLEQWSHGTFDAYWQQLGIYAEGFRHTFSNVPALLMSAWYDAYVSSTLSNYAAMSRPGRAPVALIMGPALHGDRNLTYAGDVDFGAAATFDGHVDRNWIELRARWFEHWVRGIANGVETEPRVRLFLMGGGSGRRNKAGRLDHGGRWIAANDWPIPGTSIAPYHLHGNGDLSPAQPVTDARPMSYAFDPRDPVPTIGGALTSGRPVFEGGGFDQREDARFFGCRTPGSPLASRPDVLVFETEPLSEDVAIIGPIRVELWVSSDAPDTDFTAKLIDVYPSSVDYPTGFALNITDGIFRCRYRKSWSEPEPIKPGEIFPITIEPFATANLFKAGHRIRLDISSSNFPHFDVNPNTGEAEGSARTWRVATNAVHVDREHPSRLILPIATAAQVRDLPPRP